MCVDLIMMFEDCEKTYSILKTSLVALSLITIPSSGCELAVVMHLIKIWDVC